MANLPPSAAELLAEGLNHAHTVFVDTLTVLGPPPTPVEQTVYQGSASAHDLANRVIEATVNPAEARLVPRHMTFLPGVNLEEAN